MNSRDLVAVVVAFVASMLVGVVLASIPEVVRVVPPSGYQPLAIVVLSEAPSDALVCSDPRLTGGLLSCRPVSEFRTWVRERPLRK
jgi:hypothetical protein